MLQPVYLKGYNPSKWNFFRRRPKMVNIYWVYDVRRET